MHGIQGKPPPRDPRSRAEPGLGASRPLWQAWARYPSLGLSLVQAHLSSLALKH